MYEDDDEPDDGETPTEKRPSDPKQRAKEKADGLRMHAELAAIYEGPRKFDAAILPHLDAELARDVQQAVGKLAKARAPETPVLPAAVWPQAADLLAVPEARGLSTNDYHLRRRPGEVTMARWLAGDQVESFYERMQAHFDVALQATRDEERSNLGWKGDAATNAYLDALDALAEGDDAVRMADRYLRDAIKQHKLYVCSTLAADEIHVGYLCEHLMGIEIADLVGEASAPPPGATDKELAWFYKLFSVRGVTESGEERMCFFTYLQKTEEDEFDFG